MRSNIHGFGVLQRLCCAVGHGERINCTMDGRIFFLGGVFFHLGVGHVVPAASLNAWSVTSDGMYTIAPTWRSRGPWVGDVLNRCDHMALPWFFVERSAG